MAEKGHWSQTMVMSDRTKKREAGRCVRPARTVLTCLVPRLFYEGLVIYQVDIMVTRSPWVQQEHVWERADHTPFADLNQQGSPSTGNVPKVL